MSRVRRTSFAVRRTSFALAAMLAMAGCGDVLVLAGGQVSSTDLMTILGDLEPLDLPAGLPAIELDARIDIPPSGDLSFDI